MNNKINILELLSACINLAKESGDIIRGVFNSGELNVQMKGKDDPMTQADLLSQQHIIGGLNNLWSNLTIVGEESCEIPKIDKVPSINTLDEYSDQLELKKPEFKRLDINDLIIFIDPLDATREFTNGRVACVMTLIGISYKGSPIAGVIYQPFVDIDGNATIESNKWVGRTVWAIVGLPVFGLKDKRDKDDIGKIILVTTASHNNQQVEDAINKIKPDKLIRTGGAGYKTLMVIENLADVYVFPTVGTKLWDICGPHAILLAINGSLTDPFGNQIVYSNDPSKIDNKYGVVITIGDHNKYINLLNNK